MPLVPLPDLVVIKITPLLAREPYKAAALAPFSTVIDSTSSGFTKPALEEFWRVLKSNGRLLLVVPNRMGLWARAHWTPFGHGMPYSAGQVEEFLRENLFIIERTERALFVPPFKSQTLLRTAGLWEKVGKTICPAMGGMIFVEASKQIYASTGKGKPVRVTAAQTRPVTQGAPEPT